MSIYTLPEVTRFMKGLERFINAPKAKPVLKSKGTSKGAQSKAVLKRRRRNRISRLARRVNR